MKKNLLLLLFFGVSISFSSRAQYVALPDSNFGNWLNAYGWGSCLSGNGTIGWRLDTTNSIVANTHGIYISYSLINDLTGITYFRHLDTFYSEHNSALTHIAPLPNGLKWFNSHYDTHLLSLPAALPDSLHLLAVQYSSLRSVPSFPAMLNLLYLDGDSMHTIPALPPHVSILSVTSGVLDSLPALPADLIEFYCSANNLHSIPSLPSGVTKLMLGANPLIALPVLPAGLLELYSDNVPNLHLPAILPSNLSTLSCSFSNTSSLPSLPPTLRYLYATDNPLSSLPALPNNLVELWIQRCNFYNLPTLPSGLTGLYADYNHLTTLPFLPPHLSEFELSYNDLVSLPPLPNTITDFSVRNNVTLSCLPPFNPIYTIQRFIIDTTNITCVPNAFPGGPALPLCGVGGGCAVNYNIAGNVHEDTSATCMDDSLNNGVGVGGIKLLLSAGGNVIRQTYSNGYGYGEYSFKTDSIATYTVSIDTSNVPFRLVCPSASGRVITETATDSIFLYQDLGIGCRGIDNGVSSISAGFRAARQSTIWIAAGDMARHYGLHCSNNVGGTVTTKLAGPLRYIGPANGALTPSSVSGNLLTYNIADFDNLSAGAFNVIVATDTFITVGTYACITTVVSTTGGGDIDQSNDSLTVCVPVSNSLDPNEKTAYPSQTVDTGRQWITYTIHFQNTGNDTAFNIVVRDTLSASLDPLTFQFLASDHNAHIDLLGSAVTFTFTRINLIDSLHNKAQSTGWLQYRIKTKAGLPAGTQILNTASIYFDFNPAVVTNTTDNTVSHCTNTYINTSHSLCGGSYTFGGQTLTRSGTYSAVYAKTAGCDSIVTLLLTVGSASSSTLNRSICAGNSFTFGTHTLSVAGTYRDTLTASGGCDSIVTLSLTVNPLPAQPHIVRNGTTLSVTATGHVQWYYNGILQSGDTTSSISVTQNGLYTLELTDANGCTTMSDTLSVTHLSISDVDETHVRIYPNPNSGSFTLETNNQIGATYIITDMLGQIVQEKAITADKQHIDMGSAAAGVYTLMLKGKTGAVRVVLR